MRVCFILKRARNMTRSNRLRIAVVVIVATLLALATLIALADDSTRHSPPELPTQTPPSITAEPYPPPAPYPPPLPPGAWLPFVEGYP